MSTFAGGNEITDDKIKNVTITEQSTGRNRAITKYIGFYDSDNNKNEGREYALSAATKMDYVTTVLNRLGQDVLIISPSQTALPASFPGRTQQLLPDVQLRLFRTFGRTNIVMRVLRQGTWRLDLLRYLLTNTKPDETLIVYHSLAIQEIVMVAKLLRRFRLILEVEEIYHDVVKTGLLKRWFEDRVFKIADAFILSTPLLDKRVNRNSLPQTVIHGNYISVRAAGQKLNDGKTHVVYAGTLDKRKGAHAAIAAAGFLDNSFCLHILGSGSESEHAEIGELIRRTNLLGRGTVTFHGLLRGKDYSHFLHSCDIGVAPQDPSATFSETSFPSKIISYFQHGLKVVSVRIAAVEKSPLSLATTFYDGSDPQDIASAVRAATEDVGVDVSSLLTELDKTFARELKHLLSPENAMSPQDKRPWIFPRRTTR